MQIMSFGQSSYLYLTHLELEKLDASSFEFVHYDVWGHAP